MDWKRFYADDAAGEAGREAIRAALVRWADGDPVVTTTLRAGGIAAGKVAYYTVATCWSCHPAYESEADILQLFADAGLEPPSLRPNIREAETKESNWGAPIRAPDFLVDRIKTGFEVESVARVIASGVGGTAMPTWAGSLEQEQIWGIAYYVNDLALKRAARTKGNQP